ncbi:MAG: class I SAM-dependent methyltransferase [Magnetococcales bacterium]|nr:class I SAM-dependent methyltransferase [Magnetococcales bacterium]
MSDHATTIQTVFNKHAQAYDQTRRGLIPPYDPFYGTVSQLLRAHLSGPIRVLDLGAGTGLLSGMVLSAFPDASVTLIDLSEAMLERARERLSDHVEAVTFRVGDYAHASLGGPFDAIVSALSIHHIAGEGKLALFRQVFQALQPGGIFINADQVAGSSPEIEAHYRKNWLERVIAAGVTEETLAGARERMLADRMSPLADQLRGLAEAGFTQVNCWFKDFSFAVYSGRKLD